MGKIYFDDATHAMIVETVADMTAALRYLDGETMPVEHVQRWRDDLKAALDKRQTQATPGRKTAGKAAGGG